jgi:hypothetical protein
MSARHGLLWAFALVTALACAGLAAAAALVPAPAGVIPVVAITSVMPPMLVTWHLANATTLRQRWNEDAAAAMSELRVALDELPEAEHPLGL